MPPTVTELALVVQELVSQRVTSDTFSRRGPYSGAIITLKRKSPLQRWIFRGELTLTHSDSGVHPVALADHQVRWAIKSIIQAQVRSGGLRRGSVYSVVIERAIQKAPKRIVDVTVKFRLCPFVVCTHENRKYLHIGNEEFEMSDETAGTLASLDDEARLAALEEVVGGHWSIDEVLNAGGNSRQWNLDAILGAAAYSNIRYDRETRRYTIPTVVE